MCLRENKFIFIEAGANVINEFFTKIMHSDWLKRHMTCNIQLECLSYLWYSKTSLRLQLVHLWGNKAAAFALVD